MKLVRPISAAIAVALSTIPVRAGLWSRSDIPSIAESISNSNSTNPIPRKIGFLGFPRFVGIDVYGPLDLFNIVAFNTPNMTLSIIGETLDFIPAHVTNPDSGPLTWLKPTYTIDDDPDIDVLFIPGTLHVVFCSYTLDIWT
jgi:hypothetical protein